MDDKMIYDLLKEVRDEQRDQGKCLTRMEVDIKRNTEDLIDHMEQTKTVKDLHAQNEKRIEYNEMFLYGDKVKDKEDHGIVGRVEDLEAPAKAKAYLRKKYMVWAGVISVTVGIAVGLGKIFGWF